MTPLSQATTTAIKNKKSRLKMNFQTGLLLFVVVIPSGFEPEAYCLEGTILL
jgi:hypothetical protein